MTQVIIPILVGAGQCIAKGHKRIREIGIRLISQGEIRSLRHSRKPWRIIFRVIRSERLHMIPVGTFPDNDDIRAIRRILPFLESHGSYISINVIIHLRKYLEITSLAFYGTININREYMGKHAVKSADKQNGNQHQPDFSFSSMTLYRILTGSSGPEQRE